MPRAWHVSGRILQAFCALVGLGALTLMVLAMLEGLWLVAFLFLVNAGVMGMYWAFSIATFRDEKEFVAMWGKGWASKK